MKPSAALAAKRDAVVETVRRYPVSNLRVFGSVARGEDDEASDIDLLVDPLPGLTLSQLGGLQSALEDLLGVSVEIVLSDGLHRRIRDRVLSEARPV